MGASNQITLNAKELVEFLTHVIENNRFLQSKGKIPIACEVEGVSGIGKTSVVLQLGEQMKLPVVKLNLASIEELGDLIGFPLRQFEMCKEQDDYLWIDEQAIGSYEKEGYKFTGNKRMSYAPPEWVANMKDGGILLLDDYSRADQRYLQACMELIDRQTYISWSLPKDWHIVLSTNPDNGDYHVNTMDQAQRSRFLTVNMKFDVDCWARWAESDGLDSRCINFMLMHPEVVTDKVDPRSIVKFFDGISSFKDFSASLSMIQMMGEGSVGSDFATMFTLFINNKLDKLITPKNILTHKDYDKVKEVMLENIGKGDEVRADIASVLTTRTLNYALHMNKQGEMTQEIIKRLTTIATDNVLTNDLKYYLVKGLLENDRQKFQSMMMHPQIMKMSVK
jgi:hypothetical protein